MQKTHQSPLFSLVAVQKQHVSTLAPNEAWWSHVAATLFSLSAGFRAGRESHVSNVRWALNGKAVPGSQTNRVTSSNSLASSR